MSHNIRPVREDWGPHSSRFVEPETFARVLDFLASTIDSPLEESPHTDGVLFWVGDGGAALTLLTLSSPGTLVRAFLMRHPECHTEESPLRSLFENLHHLAPEWREFLDTDDQSLRILSD